MVLCPVFAAISRKLRPCSRNFASLRLSMMTCGRPSTFPCDLALSRPLRTRLEKALCLKLLPCALRLDRGEFSATTPVMDNILMPTKKATPSVFQLKITLVGIEPPIWRRIQVPSTIPMCCLHDALQAVMGWTDSHLHQFEKDGKYWGVPDPDGYEDDIKLIDESKVPVGKVLKAEGDSLVYLYDFGDGWRP